MYRHLCACTHEVLWTCLVVPVVTEGNLSISTTPQHISAELGTKQTYVLYNSTVIIYDIMLYIVEGTQHCLTAQYFANNPMKNCVITE